MNTAVKIQEVRIKDISVTEDTITAQLMDGRIISVPLAWSWRLSEAPPNSAHIGELLETAMGCIGLTSMRISAPKECFMVFPLQDLEYLQNSALNQNKIK